MALPAEASASAAVAALFFVLTAFSPLNFKLTGKGFQLYIPLGISTAMRGIAHAARARFFVSHNVDLMAVYGALNAAGFGIAVAMCCAFIIIWLRNAAHYQSPTAAKALSVTVTLLIACVITFGPVLGVVAAIVVYGSKGDLSALQHGQFMRLASSAGFTAVTALALLISTYLALSWLIKSREAAAAMAHALPPKAAAAAGEGVDASSANLQQQQQQQHRQDRLVFVLSACLFLLLWTSSSRLAQYDHPVVLSSTVLYHCISVLPELIVAAVMAVPTLAARIALGGRYDSWLEQRKGSKAGNSSNSYSSSSGSIISDAEVGLPSGVQLSAK